MHPEKSLCGTPPSPPSPSCFGSNPSGNTALPSPVSNRHDQHQHPPRRQPHSSSITSGKVSLDTTPPPLLPLRQQEKYYHPREVYDSSPQHNNDYYGGGDTRTPPQIGSTLPAGPSMPLDCSFTSSFAHLLHDADTPSLSSVMQARRSPILLTSLLAPPHHDHNIDDVEDGRDGGVHPSNKKKLSTSSSFANVGCHSGSPPGSDSSASSSPLAIVATVIYRDGLRRRTLHRWRRALKRQYQRQDEREHLAGRMYQRGQLKVYWAAWEWRFQLRQHMKESRWRAEKFRHDWKVRATWEAWCKRVRVGHQQRRGVAVLLDGVVQTRVEWAWRCWYRWTMRRQLSVALASSSAQCLRRQRWMDWRWSFLLQRKREEEMGRALSSKLTILSHQHFLSAYEQDEISGGSTRGTGCVALLQCHRSILLVDKCPMEEVSPREKNVKPNKDADGEIENMYHTSLLRHYALFRWWRRQQCRRFIHRLRLLEKLSTLQGWRKTSFRLSIAWHQWERKTIASRLWRKNARQLQKGYFGLWRQWELQEVQCYQHCQVKISEERLRCFRKWYSSAKERQDKREKEMKCTAFYAQRTLVCFQKEVWDWWCRRYNRHFYLRCLNAVLSLARRRLLQQLAFRRLVESQYGTLPRGLPLLLHAPTSPAPLAPSNPGEEGRGCTAQGQSRVEQPARSMKDDLLPSAILPCTSDLHEQDGSTPPHQFTSLSLLFPNEGESSSFDLQEQIPLPQRLPPYLVQDGGGAPAATSVVRTPPPLPSGSPFSSALLSTTATHHQLHVTPPPPSRPPLPSSASSSSLLLVPTSLQDKIQRLTPAIPLGGRAGGGEMKEVTTSSYSPSAPAAASLSACASPPHPLYPSSSFPTPPFPFTEKSPHGNVTHTPRARETPTHTREENNAQHSSDNNSGMTRMTMHAGSPSTLGEGAGGRGGGVDNPIHRSGRSFSVPVHGCGGGSGCYLPLASRPPPPPAASSTCSCSSSELLWRIPMMDKRMLPQDGGYPSLPCPYYHLHPFVGAGELSSGKRTVSVCTQTSSHEKERKAEKTEEKESRRRMTETNHGKRKEQRKPHGMQRRHEAPVLPPHPSSSSYSLTADVTRAALHSGGMLSTTTSTTTSSGASCTTSSSSPSLQDNQNTNAKIAREKRCTPSASSSFIGKSAVMRAPGSRSIRSSTSYPSPPSSPPSHVAPSDPPCPLPHYRHKRRHRHGRNRSREKPTPSHTQPSRHHQYPHYRHYIHNNLGRGVDTFRSSNARALHGDKRQEKIDYSLPSAQELVVEEQRRNAVPNTVCPSRVVSKKYIGQGPQEEENGAQRGENTRGNPCLLSSPTTRTTSTPSPTPTRTSTSRKNILKTGLSAEEGTQSETRVPVSVILVPVVSPTPTSAVGAAGGDILYDAPPSSLLSSVSPAAFPPPPPPPPHLPHHSGSSKSTNPLNPHLATPRGTTGAASWVRFSLPENTHTAKQDSKIQEQEGSNSSSSDGGAFYSSHQVPLFQMPCTEPSPIPPSFAMNPTYTSTLNASSPPVLYYVPSIPQGRWASASFPSPHAWGVAVASSPPLVGGNSDASSSPFPPSVGQQESEKNSSPSANPSPPFLPNALPASIHTGMGLIHGRMDVGKTSIPSCCLPPSSQTREHQMLELMEEEDVQGFDLDTVSEEALKEYGFRVLQSYKAMKKLANAEEEELTAVAAECKHWKQMKASHERSGHEGGGGKKDKDESRRGKDGGGETLPLDRLQKRLWWLQHRKLQRQQLRARLQQIVVALEGKKESQRKDRGGSDRSFHFSGVSETPTDLSWM